MRSQKSSKNSKSEANMSKLNIYVPMYSGNKLAKKSTKSFISRSVTGLKRYTTKNYADESPKVEKYKSQNSIRMKSPKLLKKINMNPIEALQLKTINKSSNMTPNIVSCTNKEAEKNEYRQFFKQYHQNVGPGLRKILQKMNKQTEKPKNLKKDRKQRFNIKPFKKIASGQYGSIYLAYSLELKLVFALKSFKKQKVHLDFMIDQFKIQLYCKHPNILPAYGFYIGQQQCFLIMEAGVSNLYTKIKKQGCFTEEKAARYLFQIMKGISYLHLNGVIHRDIKPQNIIVCGGDVLKISDFGWSVISNNQRTTFCGTIDYVSPEVSSGRLYDNKIDCWSVGILAFEMILGYPPFPIKTTQGKHPVLNYDQKVTFPPQLSKQCKNFIRKMILKDPAIRPTINEAIGDEWIQKHVKSQKEEVNRLKMMMNNIIN